MKTLSSGMLALLLAAGLGWPIDYGFAQSAGVNSTSGELPVGAGGSSFMFLGGGSSGLTQGLIDFGSDGLGNGLAGISSPTASINTNNGNAYFGGSVGIGTSAPSGVSARIYAGATSTSSLRLEQANGSPWAIQILNDAYATGWGKASSIYQDSSGSLEINGNGTSQTPSLAIAHNGYVGIGTASPFNLLHVYASTGNNALMGVQSGSNSYWAVQANSGSNSMSIGPLATLTAVAPDLNIMGNGNVGIGTSNPQYTLDVNGSVHATAYYHGSDMRLKSDIHPIDNALDKVLAIHGVEFNWKKDGRPDMGVIAQDVARVFPDVVSHDKNNDGMMAVEYDSLVGPMIESIRQLKTENDAMKAQLNTLTAAVKNLQQDNARLRSVRVDGADAALHNPSSVVEP